MQMRTQNSFLLFSDWSDAIVIDVLNVTVESNITSESPEAKQLPPYVFAVIAVAVAILLVVLLVLIIMCIVFVRKHFCIAIVS